MLVAHHWMPAPWFGLLVVVVPNLVLADEVVDSESVAQYVRVCRKPNGAFGPLNQEYTDAAWNYPAVRTLALLGKKIENKPAILKHGLGFPKGHGGYGHWLFFHRQMIRGLLAKAVNLHDRKIKLVFQGYKPHYYGSPFGKDSQLRFRLNSEDVTQREHEATQLGYYNLSSLYYVLAGLKASEAAPSNPHELVQFIKHRQAPSGGFVDLRVADRKPKDDEAHIAHTFHAVSSLKLLGSKVPRPADCVRFAKACRLPTGAYRWNPSAALPGNEADVYYTWAAVQVLRLLDETPPQRELTVKWLNSLQNHDGGFGDKPGWRSRLYSTYYAVHSLKLLTGHPTRGIRKKSVKVPETTAIPDGDFQIFQGLHKMPVCTAEELPELRKRGFNLLALKTDDFKQAEPLLAAIKAKKLPMDVVLCPEAYPHTSVRHGGLLLNHIANITLDPRWKPEQRVIWTAADQAGRKGLRWSEYLKQVVQPLRKLDCLVYPEHEFEMEYGYSAYDAGVSGSGYNAVLAGFNWPPRDFVRVFPWRERYTDKLTPIADADAHGDLRKWSSQLDHTRHLFLAEGPSYADFLEAAGRGRVVCVIYDPEGVPSGVSYYGSPAAVAYVKKHQAEWKWWK